MRDANYRLSEMLHHACYMAVMVEPLAPGNLRTIDLIVGYLIEIRENEKNRLLMEVRNENGRK